MQTCCLRKVESEDRTSDICMLYLNEIPIGQIRLSYCGNCVVIDYNIYKQYQGQGYGRQMLVLLEESLDSRHRDITRIEMDVAERNIAVKRKIEQLGYRNAGGARYKKELIKPRIENNNCIGKKENGILLCANNENALDVYEWLNSKNISAFLYSDKLSYEQVANMGVNFIISYNYDYLITEDIIDLMQGKIVNMHISLLPYNRGFSPNFWSFIDDTPKGVTIHYISKGLDEGNILVQKELFFDEKEETFVSTYNKLNDEIKQLFFENWDDIYKNRIISVKQVGKGTYHTLKDLKEMQSKIEFNWSDNVYYTKKRIREHFRLASRQ